MHPKLDVTTSASVEKIACDEYISRAGRECPFSGRLPTLSSRVGLLVTQGFEERSLGIIERLAATQSKVTGIVINRYAEENETDINSKYKGRFEEAAQKLSPGNCHVVSNDCEGRWISKSLSLIDVDEIILDITAISNRGVFGVLDAVADCGKKVWIAYSEPQCYWPTKLDWDQLEKELSGHQTLADLIDGKPWLSGYSHRVELVPGHDGYDSAGSGRALVGFLPFKRARIAAVLGEQDYEECLFIAGKPRLVENYWRLIALKKINEGIVKDWPVEVIETFGYLNTVKDLSVLLCGNGSLLSCYDVHLAIMGSKLQTIGCWVLSSIIPSLTLVTSVPSKYYPEAFSSGVGSQWIFSFLPPPRVR